MLTYFLLADESLDLIEMLPELLVETIAKKFTRISLIASELLRALLIMANIESRTRSAPLR